MVARFMVGLFVVGITVLSAMSLIGVPSAFGWTGSPGVITFESCTRGKGEGCRGTYVSSDGSTVKRDVWLAGEGRVGESQRVRTAPGGYQREDVGWGLADLAVSAGGLAMGVTCGWLVLCRWKSPSARARTPNSRGSVV